MKRIISILLTLNSSIVFSQICKPDLDNTDKITKQTNKAWESIIYQSSFGNSFVNTSDWYLAVQYGRFSNENDILLFLTKYEESAQNQTFESQYKAEKGNIYYFAFSQGEAIKLIVEDTKTVSKMDNFSGKLITTVTIATRLTDDLIKQFKDRFNSGILTTVRLQLSGHMNFEKDVKDKKAETAKEKFNCFLDWISKNPLKATTQGGGDAAITGFPPLDAATGKVTYAEVVTVDAATPAKQLYDRAKKWMIDYYKDTHINLDQPEEGRLGRNGSFMQTFTYPNGKQSSEDMSYSVAILVKDGKYKYTITDIIDSDGKTKQTAEEAREILKKMPASTATLMIEQYNQGFNTLINSLKAAMKQDAVKKDDW